MFEIFNLVFSPRSGHVAAQHRVALVVRQPVVFFIYPSATHTNGTWEKRIKKKNMHTGKRGKFETPEIKTINRRWGLRFARALSWRSLEGG